MMKIIELFWNIVYYGIYQFDVFLRYLIGFINPFNFINKNKGIRRYYSAHGVDDMNRFRNRIFNDRRTGISITISNATIGGLLVLFEYGLFNVIQGITKKPLIDKIWQDGFHLFIYLIIMLVPAFLINKNLLFKNYKYLRYFDEFEKLEKSKKQRYYCVSLISVFLIVLFFFVSFYFVTA